MGHRDRSYLQTFGKEAITRIEGMISDQFRLGILQFIERNPDSLVEDILSEDIEICRSSEEIYRLLDLFEEVNHEQRQGEDMVEMGMCNHNRSQTKLFL